MADSVYDAILALITRRVVNVEKVIGKVSKEQATMALLANEERTGLMAPKAKQARGRSTNGLVRVCALKSRMASGENWSN